MDGRPGTGSEVPLVEVSVLRLASITQNVISSLTYRRALIGEKYQQSVAAAVYVLETGRLVVAARHTVKLLRCRRLVYYGRNKCCECERSSGVFTQWLDSTARHGSRECVSSAGARLDSQSQLAAGCNAIH